LELIYYTRYQKNKFGALDPNVKLLIEEVVKQHRTKIKEGFAVHEAAFTKHLDEVAIAKHLRDVPLINLDKALAEWRTEVDVSIAYLQCLIHVCPRKWKMWLPTAEFWYNCSFHSSLG
jgi:2',3'-cyclic-nucleotide 2'-phosphodiesterase (5'-nucleotidase family)